MSWIIVVLVILALSVMLVLSIKMYEKLYKAYEDKKQRYNSAMACLTDLTNTLNDHFDSNLTVIENDDEIKVVGEIKYLVKD